MTKDKNSGARTSRWLIAAFVLVPLIGMPAAALAVGNNVLDGLGHAVDCTALAFTDPGQHDTLCTPIGHNSGDAFGLLRQFDHSPNPILSSSATSSGGPSTSYIPSGA